MNATQMLGTLGEAMDITADFWYLCDKGRRAQLAVQWGMKYSSWNFVTLGQWLLSPDCTVDLIPDGGTGHAGFAVTGRVPREGRTELSILLAAPAATVDEQLGDLFRRYASTADPFWFGPPIAPCESWCSSEHDSSDPDAVCETTVGQVETAPYDDVQVLVKRWRDGGTWADPAEVIIDGATDALTPTQAAQLGRLVVLASDVAAGTSGTE